MKGTYYDPGKMESRAVDIIDNVPLNATEIGACWNTYMQYTMFVCIFKYFSQTAEDNEIRPIMEDAVDICAKRVKWVTELFNKEGLPIPFGFSDNDVDLTAPRLFTDPYYLYYMINANKISVGISGLSFVTSGRADVRDFYDRCINSTIHLFNNSINVLLSKGLYVRPPLITVSKNADYVKNQDFLGGFLGERRTLLAQEISALFYGIVTNNVGKRLLMGFRQTARSNQVRKYMDRGIKLANNLIETFSSSLTQEDIPDPVQWDFMVTDSTTPPFSDKLMMYHTILITTAGILNYAASLATSPRHDLVVHYTKALNEVANYSEDGINIMIDNGWYEEPPRTVDRRKLVNKPKH
ncbi:MAG: hypothetical protein A4E52_00860 [Pelotomaculum sp. PtaB.Bin013]|uniref:DUF3231 family protein n=1 Tax=Pelotomaculum isophthalicicum JI TaxID=947010 RepID=A0A9X4H2P3_9FIRM|nr:DUF3231 family protein [Pelotomaculum isophthalicicum]MDF9407443.1 DUF3231 family protein [Pelotomaculum isophthalicicum JI]OPX90312.1 MAG: hypothetical protein A4E52_00860 [Pelotomaculum sp. PtaB.Bin013]